MEALENTHLRVTIQDDGCWSVVEKQSGTVWAADPWEGSSGEIVMKSIDRSETITLDLKGSKRVSIRKGGSGVLLVFDDPSVKGTDGHANATFKAQIKIEGDSPELTVEITQLSFDETKFELDYIDYPLRMFPLRTHVDHGYLAIPATQGAIMPTYPVALGATDFWDLEDRCLDVQAYKEVAPTMPWFGACNGAAGFVCILETDDDVHVSTVLNYDFQHAFLSGDRRSPYQRIAVAYPRWLASEGKLRYARRMRYAFGPRMGYVGMAKRYRQHAREAGLLETLKEKQEGRPQIAKLVGAPCIDFVCGYPHYASSYPPFKFTYAGLREVVRDLHEELGLKKALFHFWGAFEHQPPRTLPFDTRPGSVDELKALVRFAQDECGFLFSLYTDFSALLQWSGYWNPDLLVTMRGGGHLVGLPWLRVCSGTYLDSAREVMAVLARELGVQASYIDCLGGPILRECYSAKHPTTRTGDRRNRCDVFEYIRSLGLVYGGERMAAWGMRLTDYGNSIGIDPETKLFRLFPVPLFHLVFHDAAVLYRDAFDHYAELDGYGFELKVLQDLLNGVPPIFYLTPRNYREWRGRIKLADSLTSKTVAAVGYDEMVSHEFLSDDFLVQRTTFSSGVTVTTNARLCDWDGDGPVVRGRGFHVAGGPLGVVEGHFTTDLNVSVSEGARGAR